MKLSDMNPADADSTNMDLTEETSADAKSPETKKEFKGMKSSGTFHFWNSIKYSYAGYKEGLLHDSSIRQETLFGVIGLGIIYFLPVISVSYKMLMFFGIVCVLAAEFFNSAIEDAIDLACPEIHPIAKRGKDFASAAVCLIICSNIVIWGVALWQIYCAMA